MLLFRGYVSQTLQHYVACLCITLLCVEFINANNINSKKNNDVNFDIDNLLNSIDSAVNKVFDYLGEPDGCFFKCPNGIKPTQDPTHVPSSNGCGAAGMAMLDTSKLPGVTKCCNAHDYCYDTCNKEKDLCDKQFQECLTNICKDMKKIFSNDIVDGCLTTADLMYAGVMALGCKPYRESQMNACLCVGLEKKRTEL